MKPQPNPYTLHPTPYTSRVTCAAGLLWRSPKAKPTTCILHTTRYTLNLVRNVRGRLAMAMLADIMEALAAHPGTGDRYVATFMPHMLMGCMSTDLELRQAALFGVGLCAQHGGVGFGPYRAEAVQVR